MKTAACNSQKLNTIFHFLCAEHSAFAEAAVTHLKNARVLCVPTTLIIITPLECVTFEEHKKENYLHALSLCLHQMFTTIK